MQKQYYLVTYIRREDHENAVYKHLINAKSWSHAAGIVRYSCSRNTMRLVEMLRINEDDARDLRRFETPHKVGRA